MGCGNTLNEVLSRDLLVNNLPKSCVHDFFKVGLSPSKKKLFVFFNDSPSKMMALQKR